MEHPILIAESNGCSEPPSTSSGRLSIWGDTKLEQKLAEWQHFYDCHRPPDNLGGCPLIDRVY